MLGVKLGLPLKETASDVLQGSFPQQELLDCILSRVFTTELDMLVDPGGPASDWRRIEAWPVLVPECRVDFLEFLQGDRRARAVG